MSLSAIVNILFTKKEDIQDPCLSTYNFSLVPKEYSIVPVELDPKGNCDQEFPLYIQHLTYRQLRPDDYRQTPPLPVVKDCSWDKFTIRLEVIPAGGQPPYKKEVFVSSPAGVNVKVNDFEVIGGVETFYANIESDTTGIHLPLSVKVTDNCGNSVISSLNPYIDPFCRFDWDCPDNCKCTGGTSLYKTCCPDGEPDCGGGSCTDDSDCPDCSKCLNGECAPRLCEETDSSKCLECYEDCNCPEGEECWNNICVPKGCSNVICPPGETCVQGVCYPITPCDEESDYYNPINNYYIVPSSRYDGYEIYNRFDELKCTAWSGYVSIIDNASLIEHTGTPNVLPNLQQTIDIGKVDTTFTDTIKADFNWSDLPVDNNIPCDNGIIYLKIVIFEYDDTTNNIINTELLYEGVFNNINGSYQFAQNYNFIGSKSYKIMFTLSQICGDENSILIPSASIKVYSLGSWHSQATHIEYTTANLFAGEYQTLFSKNSGPDNDQNTINDNTKSCCYWAIKEYGIIPSKTSTESDLGLASSGDGSRGILLTKDHTPIIGPASEVVYVAPDYIPGSTCSSRSPTIAIYTDDGVEIDTLTINVAILGKEELFYQWKPTNIIAGYAPGGLEYQPVCYRYVGPGYPNWDFWYVVTLVKQQIPVEIMCTGDLIRITEKNPCVPESYEVVGKCYNEFLSVGDDSFEYFKNYYNATECIPPYPTVPQCTDYGFGLACNLLNYNTLQDMSYCCYVVEE